MIRDKDGDAWDSSHSQGDSGSGSGESLRERYVERTLEKILRYQREPPMRPVDYVILMLLVVAILVMLFKPTKATVDISSLQKTLDEIKTRADELSQKQVALGKEISALRTTVQKQPAAPKAPVRSVRFPEMTPSPTLAQTPSPHPSASPTSVRSSSPSPLASASTPAIPHPSPSPSVIRTPLIHASPKPGGVIKPGVGTPSPSASPSADAAHGGELVHVLQPGESLWSICQKQYGDARYLNSLARYNGIDNPSRLHVGSEIRLPPLAKLNKGRKAPVSTSGGGRD